MTQDEIQEYNNMLAAERLRENERIEIDAREKRNRLLKESDWAVVVDAPTDKKAWKAYRQALRDVTSQPGFPTSIDWPVAPK